MKNYHATVEDLIVYILKNGEDYLDQIDAGNAYDKILRNYHQFNSSGDKVYRRLKLMVQHYKFSKNAWKNRENKKELYFEHLYPINKIKSHLRALIGTEFECKQVRDILRLTDIVVITREESRLVDKKYKTEIPQSGKDRLSEVEIQIEPQTEKNSLWR